MKRRILQVSVHAKESSIVELTVGDRVQLDRLVPSQYGTIAERHGRLLEPGTTTLALAQGHYLFRTLSDANLKVVRGGVDTSTQSGGKTDPPEQSRSGDPIPSSRGDGPTDAALEVATFTVEVA